MNSLEALPVPLRSAQPSKTFAEQSTRPKICQEKAGRVNRTRRRWRTRGFFRFLPVADETAGELPTRPARLRRFPKQTGGVKAPPFLFQWPAPLLFCRALRESMFSNSTSAEKAMAA